MTETQQEARGRSRSRHGLVIVYTGNGKGKTTAALGTVLRAWGRDMRCCVMQFIKSEKGHSGESRAAKKMGVEWYQMGDGFTWESKDIEESAAKAQHGWAMAQEKIASGEYDLIVLDEFTYPLKYGWLDVDGVLDWLRANKPRDLHLIVTGRSAPRALIEFADLVTEMRQVKHPFEQGVLAQAGVEF